MMITIIITTIFYSCASCAINSDAINTDTINSEEETQVSYGYNKAQTITPSQARAKMAENPDAIILDVRTQDEFDQGHIPGAILLPDYSVETYASYVLPDTDALILVYCRSGRRSLNTANLLVSMGYTNVYDFGGILDWPYESE